MISKEIFNKEVKICKKHFQKKQSCAWGKCDSCGALPLLVKLYEGKIIEEKDEILNLKNKIFEK
jgi:hypothetical protein